MTSLTENDVLLGRGTPCAENEGNVRFRKLVRSRKAEYTAAEKRMRKDAIAREVLDVIAARGGKFLRKVESKAEMMQLGIPLCTGGVTPKEVWAIVDEDTQVQKVKQALRNKDDIGPVMERDDDEEDDDVQRLTSSPTGTASTGSKGTYTDRDVTNRFPKGVVTNSSHNHDDKIDSSAEGKIMFGGGAPRSGGLEQVGKGSPDKSKGSPEKGKFVLDSPTKKKSLPPKLASRGTTKKTLPPKLHSGSSTSSKSKKSLPPRLASGSSTISSMSKKSLPPRSASKSRRLSAVQEASSSGSPPLDFAAASPVGREIMMLDAQRLSGAGPGSMSGGVPPPPGFNNMMRLRMQMGMGQGPADLMNMPSSRLGGGGLDNMGFGAMNAEFRQLQAQQQQQQQQVLHVQAQQLQAQRMAAAAAAASRDLGGPGVMGPSAVQLQAAAARRASTGTANFAGLNLEGKATATTMAATRRDSSSSARSSSVATQKAGRGGADSAGERAIGIAQAMKRADAFSPEESLELSHLETLVLSVLCSNGLPVWDQTSHMQAFVVSMAHLGNTNSTNNSGGWTWVDFAATLRQRAGSAEWGNSKHTDAAVAELAVDLAAEYLTNPKELATVVVMLMEKVRRHSSGGAVTGSTQQRKQWSSGLGVQVPAWLDGELSRWALTLDIADSAGRPVPFSSSDFVANHPGFRENPSIVATAAFDPQLADDVVDQVALLTRLRSIFSRTKVHEIRSRFETAVKKADEDGEGWADQPKGWTARDSVDEGLTVREVVLCDRLLSCGFSGVLTSEKELGPPLFPSFLPKSFAASCPSFESMGLTKSSIQQRANQMTRELHALDEASDLQGVMGERMERIAQSVLKANRGIPPSSTSPLLAAAAGMVSGGPGKRRASGMDPSGIGGSGSGSNSSSPRGQKKLKTSR